MAAASLVLGLAGFGNGLVAMAFLPYFMPSATAIAVLMIYTIVLAVAIFVPVRRHLAPRGGAYLLVGTMLGTPLGVWILVNQVVILAGYWWAKVLTGEVWRLGADAGSGLTLRQMFDCKT